MTLEAEGAYRRLLDHQWLNGSIPDDIKALARICGKITPARMGKLWPMIAPCFVPLEAPMDSGQVVRQSGEDDYSFHARELQAELEAPRVIGLVNRRMERVRSERLAFVSERIESGRKGGRARAENERERGQAFTGDVPPGGRPTHAGVSVSSSA